MGNGRRRWTNDFKGILQTYVPQVGKQGEFQRFGRGAQRSYSGIKPRAVGTLDFVRSYWRLTTMYPLQILSDYHCKYLLFGEKSFKFLISVPFLELCILPLPSPVPHCSTQFQFAECGFGSSSILGIEYQCRSLYDHFSGFWNPISEQHPEGQIYRVHNY